MDDHSTYALRPEQYAALIAWAKSMDCHDVKRLGRYRQPAALIALTPALLAVHAVAQELRDRFRPDAPGEPVCRCSKPSGHESEWCGSCEKTSLVEPSAEDIGAPALPTTGELLKRLGPRALETSLIVQTDSEGSRASCRLLPPAGCLPASDQHIVIDEEAKEPEAALRAVLLQLPEPPKEKP